MTLPETLAIDPDATARGIEAAIRRHVLETLRRRGAVVGISGGVDSAVTAALCARALGPSRVLGLLMPERAADGGEALALGRAVAERFGIPWLVEEIGPALDALGCARRQLDAIRRVFPDYGEAWRCKIVLAREGVSGLSLHKLVVEGPRGERGERRLPPDAHLALVAATSFKQRLRKTLEYHHADRLRYAVAGTPNRLEWDQGFFVKQGDGAADLKPIAHLYKTQVYALAAFLGVPGEVTARTPSTETFDLPQTQEEFFFGVSLRTLDLLLCARERGLPAGEAAREAGLSPDEVEGIWRDVESKRRAARYLHAPPLRCGGED
jgi:NAD+ synthase